MSPTPEQMFASVEARVKLLETQTRGWFAQHWPHFVTWILAVAVYVKKLV